MIERRSNFLVGAAILVAAVWPGAEAQTLTKLQVTTPTTSLVFFPLYDAQKSGLFAKEGLDVQAISTNGDGPDVDALIAGSAQFTLSTPNRLFMAADEGKKLLAVGSLASRMNIDCAMNKKIADSLGVTEGTPFDQKLKAMKGLTVAGTRPGAFTYLMLVAYGKRAGLVPQQDFKLIGVGGPSSMLPALENEQIAIGCTGSPFAELAVSRGKAIMFANNSGGADPNFDDFLFEMVYARPDYVQANPQVVRGFLRALFTSVNAFLAKPSADSLPAVRELYPGVADPLLIEIIDKAKATLNKSGFVSEASVEKAKNFLLSTGAIKNAPPPYAEIVDNQYLPKE